MKLIVLFLLIGAAIAGPVSKINKEFLDGYSKFTGNLYKEVAQKKKGDFIISPLSIDILLALAEYGSTGETSKQLIKGLNLPENKEKIRQAFTALTPKLNNDGEYTLSSANKIYVKEGINLVDDFKKIAKEVYGAPVEAIDFLANEAAAQKVNKWVEEKTHDKIKDFINKDLFTEDTRTLFVNAIYFRGTWVTKFDPQQTDKESFYLSDNSQIEVDLMETTSHYNFYQSRTLNAKFLELPYHGEDVTLTIVLPNNPDGLENLESKIHDVLATKRQRQERVHVKIPKFQIETSIEFNEYLQNLGIIKPFEDTAEFPKITGEPLKINKALQKARIEVNEEGTIAAVASAVDGVSRSAHSLREPEEFIANHPFIYILRYKSIELFIGHYSGKTN